MPFGASWSDDRHHRAAATIFQTSGAYYVTVMQVRELAKGLDGRETTPTARAYLSDA